MLITKKNKIIIISIIIFMVIVSSILIFNTVRVLVYREGDPKDILYVSSIEDRNDYEVFLKPNDFISNQELDQDLSYISALVEYINTNFYYKYEGSKNIKINYNYYVKANIVSNFIEELDKPTLKPVWNKEFILLDNKLGTTNNSKITINEQLKIGLDYYNNLVQDFETELNIPVDSVLEVTMIVNINGDLSSEQKLSQEHQMLMSIPLGVKAFDITTSKNFVEKETIYNKEQPTKEKSYMLAIIYIIITIGIIYAGIYIIRYIINMRKSKYKLKIDKILNEYDDRIVTVSNFVNYSKLEIINIESFDELLNMSNEVYEPIIYWERKERGVREAWFTIIRNKLLYRYVVSMSDFEE